MWYPFPHEGKWILAEALKVYVVHESSASSKTALVSGPLSDLK